MTRGRRRRRPAASRSSVQPLAALLNQAPWVAFARDAQPRVNEQRMRRHLAQAQVRLRVDRLADAPP